MKLTVKFNDRTMILNPKQIKNILSNLELNTTVKEIGIGINPSDLILHNLFISSPVIRPDKRI